MFLKACAIAVFALIAAVTPARPETLASHFVATDPPAPLPDFVFEDSKGQSLRLADFRGHAVIVNLWASWCGPCVEEMPALDRLQAILGANNVTIIALDEERNASIDVTTSFYKRHDVRHLTIYTDPSGRILSTLHARGLPVSFLINTDGQSIGTVEGGIDWSSPDTVAFLRQHLIKQPAGTNAL